MARIITEVYPLKDTEEPQDLSHVVSETSEDSMAEEKEKSMFGKYLEIKHNSYLLLALYMA